MALIRALVCSAAVAIALMPLATFAADTSTEHVQAELANGFAQFQGAQQQVADMQAQANFSAANERMIAVLKSEALRERQLNLVANATAMEQIAAALANAARAQGDVNAANSLAIAQIKAATLVTKADATLANALAQGRLDEIANAQVQSNILHQLANFISGQQAELNIANDKLISQERADAIHTPALVQEQNGLAMGANELLQANDVLLASDLAARSVNLHASAVSATLLAHAAASLKNAQAMAASAQ